MDVNNLSLFDTHNRIRRAEFDPTARIVLQEVHELANREEPDGDFATLLTTYKALGETLHLHPDTVSLAVKRLQGGGYVEADILSDKIAEGFYDKKVRIIVKLELPERLGKLKATTQQTKKQHLALVQRNLAKTANALLQTVCPECGERGIWHLTCGACGALFDHDLLAEVARQDQIKNGRLDPASYDPAYQKAAETSKADTVASRENPRKTDTVASREAPPEGATTAHHYMEGERTGQAESTKPGAGITSDKDICQNGKNISQMSVMTDTAPADGYDRTKTLNNSPALDHGPVDQPAAANQVDDLPAETLTGADIPVFMDGLGAGLTMVRPRSKAAINPVDDEGNEIGSYTEHPSSLAAVKANMRQGGNAGMTPGINNLYVLDIDDELGAFLEAFPEFAELPRITRDDPSRGKFLFLMDRDDIRSKDWKGESRKIEFKGRGGHVVIAGTHETGQTIRFTTGRLVLMSWEHIESVAKRWTGTNQRMTPTMAAALQVANRHARRVDDGSIVKAAIERKCNAPEVMATVDRLRDGRKYIAVRADDKHPSTAADHDAFTQTHRRTYYDYGSRQKYDDFELYAILTGTPKSELIKAAVAEYKAANGVR